MHEYYLHMRRYDRDSPGHDHPAYQPEDVRPRWSDLPSWRQEEVVTEFLRSQPDGEAILREATDTMLTYIAKVAERRNQNKGWVL